MTNSNSFNDVFLANEQYVAQFKSSSLTGEAMKGLAIVTCIDSRIEPLRMVGMQAGDAKILRNAGARVTEDVLRTLILATHLLGVNRIMVIPHTDCKMASGTEAEIHAAIAQRSGVDTRSVEIRTVRDQQAALSLDLVRIRTYPLLAHGVTAMGAIYDVMTGRLNPFDPHS